MNVQAIRRSGTAASPPSSRALAGGSNVIRTGRMSKPRAHISVAGMFMCACDRSIAEVGAVDAVAEHLVDDADGAVVAGDVPLRTDWAALAVSSRARAVERVHVEYVLGELVHGIAARRRSAHPHLERRRLYPAERHLHLGVVMLGRRERHSILHRRLVGEARALDRTGEEQCKQGEGLEGAMPHG